MTPKFSGTPTWAIGLGLAVCLVGVASVTLLPIGWTMNRFVVWLYYDGLHLYAFPLTAWLHFDQLAFLLNVLLTIPLGLLGHFAFPRVPWWGLGIAVLVLSGSVELAQFLLPLGREAAWSDVLANSIGGFAGAWLGHTWERRRAERLTAASAVGGSPCADTHSLSD